MSARQREKIAGNEAQKTVSPSHGKRFHEALFCIEERINKWKEGDKES
jgi:hypothetical protein